MTTLLLGVSLGLAAGISPGPMLALVLTTSMRRGARHGVAVACAPLLSDLVIVAVVLLVLRQLPPGLVGGLGVVGGVLVAAIGLLTVRDAWVGDPQVADAGGGTRRARRDFAWGAVVNLANPHPWIAWLTALGPLLLTTWQSSPGGAVALVAGFYGTLVGSKALLAGLVARGRRRLSGRGYQWALGGSGALLFAAGVVLALEFGRAWS